MSLRVNLRPSDVELYECWGICSGSVSFRLAVARQVGSIFHSSVMMSYVAQIVSDLGLPLPNRGNFAATVFWVGEVGRVRVASSRAFGLPFGSSVRAGFGHGGPPPEGGSGFCVGRSDTNGGVHVGHGALW